MQIKSFRDLRVWQGGIELVEAIYGLTQAFPKQEVYGLTSQIQRAAVSIPPNIAEGHARESTKEYLQHLSIAQASLAEVETQLEIAKRLKYISPDQFEHSLEQLSQLGRQLYALRNALLKPRASAASSAGS
ncbi:MAG TPA: four helix bundle protein [Pyrinomonadaceae bacterium]|nr:four helix bundle protein [Pyrinomonadaceae bacterium]